MTQDKWFRAATKQLLAIIKENEFALKTKTHPRARIREWPKPKNIMVQLARWLDNTGGEHWDSAYSIDGELTLIMLNVSQTNPIELLAVLLHELIHATIGNCWSHKAPFQRLAKGCGLLGPAGSTRPGPALSRRLKEIAMDLGPIPWRHHGRYANSLRSYNYWQKELSR